MKLKSDYLVKPHTKVRLSHLSTSETGDFHDKDAAEPVLAKHREQLDALQDVLYASQSRAVLIVLQGMDTAGKDGTIRLHFFRDQSAGLRCRLLQGADPAGGSP